METQSSSLKNLVGAFFFKELLSSPELYLLSQKLYLQEPLTEEDTTILERCPLPVLQKLVEIVIQKNNIPRELRMRPVIFLPVSRKLDTYGFDRTLDQCLARLYSAARVNDFGRELLQVAIDRWTGNFKTETLVRFLKKLISNSTLPVSLLGPSTAEIARSIENNQKSVLEKNLKAPLFLEMILDSGVKAIEGGGNIDTHLIASKLGFKLRVGQKIESSSQIFTKLFEVRQRLVQTKALETWYPIQKPFPKHSQNNELAQVYRLLCYARILLPEVPFIKAPVALIGLKGAIAATCFGANDIGYLATDAETSRELEIERLEYPQDTGRSQMGLRRLYERI